jgi:hypothetical protein
MLYFAASSGTVATKVTATELEGVRPEQVQQPSPTSVSYANELIHALERLDHLREKGILTDAEFEQDKNLILDAASPLLLAI